MTGSDAPWPTVVANDRTILGYEACALNYARSTAPGPNDGDDALLTELVRATGGAGCILEVGSGPGWDADWLEAQGLRVRRTDATQAFVAFQTGRGKAAERLNLLTDPLDGPHDGILAQYVLQHLARAALPAALARIAAALRPGGVFAFSIREGMGETVEYGSDGREYHVAAWAEAELMAVLEPLGFCLSWLQRREDDEGPWLCLLCRKAAGPAGAGR